MVRKGGSEWTWKMSENPSRNRAKATLEGPGGIFRASPGPLGSYDSVRYTQESLGRALMRPGRRFRLVRASSIPHDPDFCSSHQHGNSRCSSHQIRQPKAEIEFPSQSWMARRLCRLVLHSEKNNLHDTPITGLDTDHGSDIGFTAHERHVRRNCCDHGAGKQR
jgi:hypothetical protein